MIDAGVLMGAVIRVARILKNERMVFLNFKFMALHATFLFIWGLSTFLAYLPYLTDRDSVTLWYWTVFTVINFGVSFFIAFILWIVIGKKTGEAELLVQR